MSLLSGKGTALRSGDHPSRYQSLTRTVNLLRTSRKLHRVTGGFSLNIYGKFSLLTLCKRLKPILERPVTVYYTIDSF